MRSWPRTVVAHLLLFCLVGPLAGMLVLVAGILFVAGPADALMFASALIMSLFLLIGYAYAFSIGGAPAAIVGLGVALLHLKGTSERAIYILGTALGAASTPLWLAISSNLDLGWFPPWDLNPQLLGFGAAIGGLSAPLMILMSRKFRPKRPVFDTKDIDLF